MKNKKPVSISLTLPANARFLSGIRDFTLNFIKNMTDLDEKWAYRFQAVVDELCTNAMEYGSASDEKIILTLIFTPKKSFEVIVEDSGTGKSKKRAMDLEKIIEKETSTDALRGRGLSKIVKNWTDEIKFTDRPEGGLKVHITKKI